MIKLLRRLFCKHEKPKCEHEERTLSRFDPQNYEGDYWFFVSSYSLSEQEIAKVLEFKKETINQYAKITECNLGIGEFGKKYLGHYGRDELCPTCEKYKFQLI